VIGTTIGQYRVEKEIGKGGMGIVYLARDLSLNRPVAVKFLSPHVSDEGSRRRFQQEAQTASALNHPHILTVHAAGSADEQLYLVTEWIDGGTLREWLHRAQPSLRQKLELILPIADALATAHDAGILHRDIKPENILVSKTGHAKLADFGLAKVIEAADDNMATKTLGEITRAGTVVGTIAYMSPEQVSGGAADRRSDIFSFGILLYELLAGARPFQGRSDLLVLEAIRSAEPTPLGEHCPDLPAQLRNIVEKALEKDPGDRYQSMKDLVIDLRRLLRGSLAPHAAAAAPQARPTRLLVAIAIGATIVIACLVALLRRGNPAFENPLAGATFTRLTDFEGSEIDADLSPDGKFVTFLSDRDGPFDAFIGQVGVGEFVNLTKARFLDLYHEQSRSIGFTGDSAQVWLRVSALNPTIAPPVGTSNSRGIWVLPTVGNGAPRRFLQSALVASWSPDGSRLAYQESTPGDPIFISDPNGANPRRLVVGRPGEHEHYPTWSLDQRDMFYVRCFRATEADVWHIPVAGGTPERLTWHNSKVAYPVVLDDRRLLYVAPGADGSGYWIYSLDLKTHVSHRVSLGVEQYLSLSIGSGPNGPRSRLVATVANPRGSIWTVPLSLTKTMEEADARPMSLATVRAIAPRCGPNFVLYLSSKGRGDGLWKFQDGAATELWKGDETGTLVAPAAASPDGARISFVVRRGNRLHLYVMTADGTGARELAESLDARDTASWSPDGKWIAFTAEEKDGAHIFKVPADGGTPERLTEEVSYNPVWSPDGRMILYAAPQQGITFPIKAVSPDKKPVAVPTLAVTGEGNRYRFTPDGKYAVILQGWFRHQDFFAIDLASGQRTQLTHLKPGYILRNFDISPDGKQIVFDRVQENSDVVLIDLPKR
jgi:Tol biopolymer transport system component/predicted Ser/Thr protein kinase